MDIGLGYLRDYGVPFYRGFYNNIIGEELLLNFGAKFQR